MSDNENKNSNNAAAATLAAAGKSGQTDTKKDEKQGSTDAAQSSETQATAAPAKEPLDRTKRVSIKSVSGATYHNPLTADTFNAEASKLVKIDDWLEYQIDQKILELVTE